MAASIQGRVLTERGEAVRDATITVVAGPGAVPDIAPVSDAAGAFSLGNLAEGTYLLRALGPDGRTSEVATFVTEGVENVVAIVL